MEIYSLHRGSESFVFQPKQFQSGTLRMYVQWVHGKVNLLSLAISVSDSLAKTVAEESEYATVKDNKIVFKTGQILNLSVTSAREIWKSLTEKGWTSR